MAAKPFASTAVTASRPETVEVLADGVYALTAQGDPNAGAIEGEDFVVAFEARATPSSARTWLSRLRKRTDKPIRYLVLSHYHAARTLGASAFDTDIIVAHDQTRALIAERGVEDWKSEAGRLPALFQNAESIPGLTWPNLTFETSMTIDLGGDRGQLLLAYCGRGHTEGDIVAWLPRERILFAGDLVETQSALYTGDAFHATWASSTLDAVTGFGAEQLVGGRGAIAQGRAAVHASITQTRSFLQTMLAEVGAVHRAGGTVKDAFDRAYTVLAPTYGSWPIFEHCMPFNVQRLWEEFEGVDRPTIWTPERDREVWDDLQR